MSVYETNLSSIDDLPKASALFESFNELIDHMRDVGNIQIDPKAATISITAQNPGKNKVLQLGTISFTFK